MIVRHLVVAASLLLTSAAWAQDIVIGQSVALSGSNADIGRDMRDGALAVFNRANASGTLGYKIQLVTLDNANNRERAAENTQQLVAKGATVLFGYNSATNSLDALPVAQKNNIAFFAPFSGSAALRQHPNVFTVRASYREEAAKIVETKRTVGAVKAVILHYDDEVGRSNYEAAADAYVAAGMAKPRGVAIKRGATLDAAAVDALLKDAPHYILATTQYNPIGDYLKLAGERGTTVPVAALSFVNPDELAESVGGAARGTVVSQVVPSPRQANQLTTPVVKECAQALDELNGAKLNYTTLESCIAAKMLVAALKKAGPRANTRDGVLAAASSLGRVDLGGYMLNFSNGHNGSSWVDLTILSRGNRFVQ